MISIVTSINIKHILRDISTHILVLNSYHILAFKDILLII